MKAEVAGTDRHYIPLGWNQTVFVGTTQVEGIYPR